MSNGLSDNLYFDISGLNFLVLALFISFLGFTLAFTDLKNSIQLF